MKRTLRTALLATTLAMGALTVTTGIAAADTPGPQVDRGLSDRLPPRPDPTAPSGPGDLTDDTCPTHGGCDPGDPGDPPLEGPDDLTDTPPCPTHGACHPGDPGDRPDDLTDTPPCPTHGPCDPDTPGDEPADTPGDEPGDTPGGGPGGGDIPRPTRIDTGAGGSAGGGVELAWLLAGGVLVTATGGAFVGRSVRAGGRR
jgi:hypothetical protein